MNSAAYHRHGTVRRRAEDYRRSPLSEMFKYATDLRSMTQA
ncbi:MAG: hypothetical protein ACLT74_05720 [Christensenellales bacterium]